MCGIVGYFGTKDVDLTPAAATLLHRGPDMQGVSSGKGWRVAFNRLSIIDITESGMQPFSFNGVTVVMNGEIYNYKELKEEHRSEFSCRSGSDVEIVPFLYRKYGLQFLQRLNGMFAMVLLDDRNGRYFLIRDRYGKKPLYYLKDGESLYFASELKSLRELVALRPDRTNLALNMSCWLLVQPLTVFQRTFAVRAGHYLEFDGRNAIERQWYSPLIEDRAQSFEEVRDRFVGLYRQAVQFRLRSDVPVGISLSGGLDSSSMAQLAQAASSDNFVAFTANIAGKDTWEGTTDTENPRRLCRDLGIRQVETELDAQFWEANIVDIARNYDEIFLNSGTLVFYAIAAAAQARGVKVLLSGVGGDEWFGGYPWQARMRSLPRARLQAAMGAGSSRGSKRIYGLLSGLAPARVPTKLARAYRLFAQFQIWHAESLCPLFVPYMRDVERAVSERIEECGEHYFRLATQAVPGDLYNRVHYANIFTVISNQNHQLDMASMRHSVENRSPLLDFEVVEYLLTVRDEMKNRWGPKSLLRRILGEFLPAYVTQARKSGPTMPLDLWLTAGGIGPVVRQFIVRHHDLIAEWLSADLARYLADDAFYAGAAGAMRMFALASFVLWVKINIEGSIREPGISFTELSASLH